MKDGKIDVLVTLPIHKLSIHSDEFQFKGHTDFLKDFFNSNEVLMFMVSENIKIGLVTEHIALEDVKRHITKEKIISKLQMIHKSLQTDFLFRKPKIAVLGLNPHAGDKGIIGEEDEKIIVPAIKEANNKNILAFGPFAADGFFGSGNYLKFDAILAMYHDQGLIPFKIFSFEHGVNFTAGLPIVRTSPNHGVGFDIAGKGQASSASLLEAIYKAIDIYRNRKLNKELQRNAL
ncbi:MAG TPA: 4-hydroxythreonine-4-phosphate dehydrogenase PdxA [Bacteroidales bacterium]|nr:4-hydroxythreonine-4-phosphate dehydrogenase PdxA [Bacteroidales bacterium]